ncbi:MAG: hypothetical protein QGH20_01335 [Candidatus Latescibacteria bacterium]|jgi:hypothetical protein|nr:hypothetical protein [Candidatus Latescibacterota bacterium]
MSAVVAATVGRPRWKHYMAFDGDTPVTTGALLAHGDIGWLDFAATLSTHRGMGAQSALTVRRLTDACDAGLKEVTVETVEQKPDKEAPSYRNMVRLGFEVLYSRPNFILLTD